MRSLSLSALFAGLLLSACGAPPRPPASQPAAGAVKVPAGARACMDCHLKRQITGSAIRDWRQSRHAQVEVGCESCHLPPSDAPAAVLNASTSCEDTRVRRAVSSRSCAGCHPDQVKQFGQGKHALAWVAMEAMPTTAQQPHAMIAGEKGCGGCHRIGRDEGKCDSCHTRHRFVAAEARRPEACQTCHMGFDHPQWEMYSTSKHGSIYAVEHQSWDFNLPLKQWGTGNAAAAPGSVPRAPTCALCHMPEGGHDVRTAWGFLGLRLPEKDDGWLKDRVTILKGLGVLDENGKPTARLKVVEAGQVARLTAESWQHERDRMQAVCARCHAPGFARHQLEQGDRMIREADRLMADAIETVDALYRDRLLTPSAAPLPAHPDLLRFFDVDSPIEQKLWVMFLEHRQRTFQGAFHLNPDYQNWYGWAEMKRDLVEIKHEAAQLRKQGQVTPPPAGAAGRHQPPLAPAHQPPAHKPGRPR
jgi:hypothetical protein